MPLVYSLTPRYSQHHHSHLGNEIAHSDDALIHFTVPEESDTIERIPVRTADFTVKSRCCRYLSLSSFSFDSLRLLHQLRNITIEDTCFQYVTVLSLDHIPRLETLSIGNSSFVETTFLPQSRPTTNSSWYCMEKKPTSVDYLKPPENKESIHPESVLSIHHCDRLKSIVIGAKSFYLYQSFQVHGMIHFTCSPFDLRALESLVLQGMNFVFVTDLALRGNVSFRRDR